MFCIAKPQLQRTTSDGVSWWADAAACSSVGVLVAFSERQGGCSGAPYVSLNLAGHVGDDTDAVDASRSRLLEALGIAASRDALTMAEQVHGESIALVGASDAGAGAWAGRGGRGPIRETDALITLLPRTPLAMCFADCVPIILVAPGPAVAVVHAGWRGALASLPGKAAAQLAHEARCEPDEVVAYIGAHIGACHYEVSAEIMSQFVYTFGTFARAVSGGLDLDAVVSASLDLAGVAPCNIARLGVCTAEATDRFFSYRAEGGVTGRHAALVCIL